MTESEQNSRKLILRVVVKLMVMAAVCLFVWILFGSLPERGQQAKEATSYNIADMQPGDYRLVEWERKPLFIVYRKPAWEAALLAAESELYRDPHSTSSSQPDDMAESLQTQVLRSRVSGWFVSLGLGTGMGCTLVFSEPTISGDGGGFIDGCDQSRYDLAGRVYAQQAARRNTVVPKWTLAGDEMLVGGE